MNEHREPDRVPPPVPADAVQPPPLPEWPETRPFSYWAKRFLACNPFYLVSAALLLFGLYRVSVDPDFFTKETAQLAFNFTSLQFYEILLVTTAIFLARRRIWYDSTLLVGLENLLVCVPFILITQGAVINQNYVWSMCGLAGLIVLLRFGAVKRFFGEINLPAGVWGPGLLLLALNVMLPIIYRSVHEANRSGANPDFGPEFELSKYTWLLILPAAFALGNFLPHAREKGELLPQRRWLPSSFFGLWLLATVVHVYAIDYVYQLALPAAWIAPVVWVAAWTAYHRAFDLFALPEIFFKDGLAVACVFIPLLAASTGGSNVFICLTAWNATIFAVIGLVQRGNRLARHLCFASVFLLIAGLPEHWLRFLSPHFSREQFVALGVMGYAFLCTALSRNPKMAILGACLVFAGVMVALDANAGAMHWAWQSAMVFLLLQSLRWEDAAEQGAGALRIVAGILWVAHSAVWVHASGVIWLPCLPGVVVWAGCLAAHFFRGRSGQFFVLAAATLVMLTGPGHAFIGALHSTSSGVLAVIGSFLLFGLGTAAALTKHRWHHHGES